MPRLSVPLTDEQHAAIRAKALQTGVPLAEVARRFLLAWVGGEMDMPMSIIESGTVREAKARLAERIKQYPRSAPFRCYCGQSLCFPSAIDVITCRSCGHEYKRE